MRKLNSWHFSIALVAIIFAVFLGLWLWGKYYSDQGRQSRELEQNYQQFLDAQKRYEEAMRADTYGGTTPQETLNMFIDALEKGDVELASKYFALREDGTRDPQWLEALQQESRSDGLKRMKDLLSHAKSAGSSIENRFGYEILDDTGNLVGDLGLILNSFSHVWKIESL